MPSAPHIAPGVPWTSPELRDGVKAIAVQRVVAVPLLALVGLLQDHTHTVPFVLLAVVAFAGELWQLRAVYSDHWTRLPLPQLLFVDIAAVAVAVALTGASRSPIAFIGLLTIFTATFVFPPVYMAWICGWTLLTNGGVVLVDGLRHGHESLVASYLIAACFTTLLCVNAARVRKATSQRLHTLAAARRRLVADAAQAEAGDRRRISQQLHDQALQSLLSARQDLDEVAAGDPEALRYARDALRVSVNAVRDLVYDIDPAALAGTRLPEVLQALVERSSGEDGVLIDSVIAQDATGNHDDLLHAVARELLRHATANPGVTRVTLDLRRDGAIVQLQVTDDGRELAFDTHTEGSVGIASAAARIDAAGGTLSIQTTAEHGTRILVLLSDDDTSTAI